MILLKSRQNASHVKFPSAGKHAEVGRFVCIKVLRRIIPFNTRFNPMVHFPILRSVVSPLYISRALLKSASISDLSKKIIGLGFGLFISCKFSPQQGNRHACICKGQNYKHAHGVAPAASLTEANTRSGGFPTGSFGSPLSCHCVSKNNVNRC